MYPSAITHSKTHRKTNIYTTYIMVDPGILHIHTKLQPYSPNQSKAKLIPGNSTDYLLPGLK